MNLEFVIGLLLALATLGTLIYILREFLSTTQIDFRKASLSDALAQQKNTEPAPINEHLIGMTGEVVRHSDDGDRPLRVRLGSELWPARVAGAEAGGDTLPGIGAEVLVTAVQGPVVVVIEQEVTEESRE